jgi:hypothetical protein
MNAGNRDSGNDLTDDQLDALLASADQELLYHIQASTDPSATLAELMTIQADTETGNDTETGSNSSASVVTVSYPCGSTARRRVASGRRSWRMTSAVVTSAAAAVGLAILVSSVTGGRHTYMAPTTRPVVAGQSVRVVPSPTAPQMHHYSIILLFSPGQSELSTPAVSKLIRLLDAISGHSSPSQPAPPRATASGSLRVTINVSANEHSSPAHETRLSRERAQAVRNWLIAHHVASSKLHIAGHSVVMRLVDPPGLPARGLDNRS